jgi:hypothetical protein
VYAKYVFFLAGDFWRGYRKKREILTSRLQNQQKAVLNPAPPLARAPCNLVTAATPPYAPKASAAGDAGQAGALADRAVGAL